MNLKFQPIIGKKEMHFAEKIIVGLLSTSRTRKEVRAIKAHYTAALEKGAIKPFWNHSNKKEKYPPKTHSIRHNNSKVKIGDDLNLLLEISSKKHLQFTPAIKVKNIQLITLTKSDGALIVSLGNTKEDKKILSEAEALVLSREEGFDSVEELFAYFLSDDKKAKIYHGKLIHWTNFVYNLDKETA